MKQANPTKASPEHSRYGGQRGHRIVFVTGKGGVGKSVVAAATALQFARRGQNVLLAEMGRHEQALVDFERLQEMTVDFADGLANWAPSLRALGRIEESTQITERALKLSPNHLSALLNKAVMLNDLGRYEDALEVFDVALAHDAGNPMLQLNSCYALFLLGRYEQGWAAYEYRWKIRIKGKLNTPLNHGLPQWNGEPLKGRTIYVYPEQGMGDAIQFMRYLPMLARDAKAVLFQLHDVLAPMASNLPANCRLIAPGETITGADYSCALLSLPGLFKTTIDNVPAAVPYLIADPQAISKWEARLGPRRAKLRVGLVWSGNREHSNDHNRSIALEKIRSLAPGGIEYFSLQKELRDSDQAALAAWPDMQHFGDELQTFMDTAALACLMDLVISVDTSVAHLAGALARPLWILLPFVPDWRWAVGRDDTPWYPTARLFRQSDRGDWGGVVSRLCDAIRDRIPKTI